MPSEPIQCHSLTPSPISRSEWRLETREEREEDRLHYDIATEVEHKCDNQDNNLYNHISNLCKTNRNHLLIRTSQDIQWPLSSRLLLERV